MEIPQAARDSDLRRLFDSLEEEVRPGLVNFAVVLCHGDRGLAHDLYQDAWLSTLRTFPAMPDIRSRALFVYMRKAITSGFFRHLRRQFRLTSLDAAVEVGLRQEAPAVAPDADLALPPELAGKLLVLGPRLRRLMTLYVHGYSPAWIADQLGLAGEAEYNKLFTRAAAELRRAELRGEPQRRSEGLLLLRRYAVTAPGVGRIFSASHMMRSLGANDSWISDHLTTQQPVALVPGAYGFQPRFSEETFEALKRQRRELEAVPYATPLHATCYGLAGMLKPPQTWDWVGAQLSELGAQPISLRTGRVPGAIRDHYLVAEVFPVLQRLVDESLKNWKTAAGMCRALERSWGWLMPRLEPYQGEGLVFGALQGPGNNQKRKRYPPHVFEEMKRQHLAGKARDKRKAREEYPFSRWAAL